MGQDTNMNRHLNKNKKSKPIPQNRGVIELPDQMPAEVATELLCAPGARLTMRLRKNCHLARADGIFCSTLEPKSFAQNCADRCRKANASQLAKWAKRTFSSRVTIDRLLKKQAARLEILGGSSPAAKRLLEQAIEMLNRKAVACDVFMAALKSEADSRLIKAL